MLVMFIHSLQVLLGCIGDVVGRMAVEEDLVVTLLSQIHRLPGYNYTWSIHINWNRQSLIHSNLRTKDTLNQYKLCCFVLCREVVLFLEVQNVPVQLF